MTRLSFTPDADGRWLDGHFPGRPIVPGVVLLEAVVAAAGLAAPFRIERCKFLRPCLPGQSLTLHLDDDGAVIDARVNDDAGVVASVRLRRGAAPS